MKKIIQADQTLPYRLMKNKFLNRKQYNDILSIVNKNLSNTSVDNIIEMFKKLSQTGCSCAMCAEMLVGQLCEDDSFETLFDFPIMSKDVIDSNKLMVDIYSKLYGVMKARFIEHEYYSFNNVQEATLSMLGKEYDSDSKAVLELFNIGISADGIDSNGKLLFKNNKPKITDYVGTAEEIAKKKFGIDGVKSLEELTKICSTKNITFEYKDLEINEKFTGLLTKNFNFWSNYYLQKSNIDLCLDREEIGIRNFAGDYNKFNQYIKDLILQGNSITVATGPNSDVYMRTNMPMSWGKISSESKGHIMLFKGFNKTNDMVVSSYGKDYIIPKEYFTMLEYSKISKKEKINNLDSQKKV